MKKSKTAFKTLLVIFLLLETAWADNLRNYGNGNLGRGVENEIEGKDNTWRGDRNSISGVQNSIRGDENRIEGDNNVIEGNGNRVGDLSP